MALLKNRIFLPVCAAGILTGYAAAEWIMPRYFSQATPQANITTHDFMAVIGSQPQYYRQTPSGNYLAGEFAQRQKDWEKANTYIGRVLDKDPDNADLQKHAMILAMASGEVNRAIALAKKNVDNMDDNLLAILFTSLENFKEENYLAAVDTLNKAEDHTVAAFITPVLKLWAETAQGRLDLSTLENHSFYAYHAMLAGNYLNKGPIATEYALKAYDVGEVDVRDIEKSADLFVKAGEIDRAKSLYNAILEKGFSSKSIKEKLAVIKNPEALEELINPTIVKTPKEGAALVFLDMSEILLREYSDDSANIFAQMALYLDPNLDEAHMIIGNILSRNDRPTEAIASFKKIKTDSDFYKTAQRQVADLYAAEDKNEDAIKILEKLYKSHEDLDSLIQIGDIYRYDENYEDALKIYNQVLERWEDVPENYWHVLYARGMSYERLKQYDKAEKDLKAALEFRPNHPYLLNYLGYSWADQGINLEESLDMIKKAAMAQPEDGYIADSLGWVYFKMHEFESAIPHLERAVELMPYDATLNDHLGDAYWRVGRKIEAKFQWRRAVNYSEKNEEELKETIQDKLISGLPEIKNEAKTMTGSVTKELEDTTKPSL